MARSLAAELESRTDYFHPILPVEAYSLKVLAMKRVTRLPKILLLLSCCAFGTVNADRAEAQETVEDQDNKDSYYGANNPKIEKNSIAQQKSAARARQRMARLEAYRWLGYSPNRPPTTVIPFTSSNSLAWKRAARSSSHWHRSRRSRIFVTSPSYGFY